MVKDNLDDKCRKAIVEVTSNIKDIKQKLHRIETIEKDINKKTSYILETLSLDNIKKDYAGLKQYYDDTIGYEE